MRFLTSTFAVWLLAAAASAQSYLFQFPGTGSGTGQTLAYVATSSDLIPDATLAGPINTKQIVALPSGRGFYFIGDGPLQFLDANFQSFQTLNTVQGPITNAKLSPDGKYLFVFGPHFYIVNTTTNAIAATDLGVNATPTDIGFTPDSKKAWLLQNLTLTSALTPLDLTNLTAGVQVVLPTGASSIAVSPLGHLYLPTQYAVNEYDPVTLDRLASIAMFADPGTLHFTPDGSRAYFVDRTPFLAGRSINYIRTAERDSFAWVPGQALQFDDLSIAGPDRLYAIQHGTHFLWKITTTPFIGVQADLAPVANPNRILAFAISDELPSSRFMYIIEDTNDGTLFKRIDLGTMGLSTQSPITTATGVLAFVDIPPQSGAANFIKINESQTVAGGGIGQGIGAYVLDATGRPVFNAPVTFTASDSNVALDSPSGVTNANGLVQTGVAVPSIPGVYTVTLTAGAATSTFTLLVPGSGGSGGPSQMSIVRGDGQIMPDNYRSAGWAPLTVLVTDEAGNPLPLEPVTFSVTSGNGQVNAPSTQTDDNGLAQTDFFSPGLGLIGGFVYNTVHATTRFGSVDFTEIVYKQNDNGTGSPAIVRLTPNELTVGRGDVIKDFFTARITSTDLTSINAPIQHVTLRVGADSDYKLDGPGSCVNDTHSDNLGIAHCDYKVSCDLEDNSSFYMLVGEAAAVRLSVTAVSGSAPSLKAVTGNNQSGTVGQALGTLLTARVGDNCSTGIAGKDVTWTVIQGTATLSQVVSRSDANGIVSAKVTLGSTPGPIQVRVAIPNVDPVIFTLTANRIISGISLLNGGGQSALTGAAFANPLVFVVKDNTNSPAGAGLPVTFSVSGSATTDISQATTNDQGQVQVNVTAGALTGNVTITATQANFTATASLSVRAPGLQLSSTSFTNTASGKVGMVPCSLATVIANGLAPNVNGVLNGVTGFGPMPYTLPASGGVSLKVNGVPAPLQAVANQNGVQQVNFQVPCETAVGNATVVVSINNTDTTITGVPVLAGQPGVFTYSGPNGQTYAAVIRAKDGTYITPSNLAPTGETLYLILTGLGQTTPAAITNALGTNQPVNLRTVVGVDNGGVPSQVPKYLQGQFGVYYVEFTIPKTGTTGTIKRDVNFAIASVSASDQFTFDNQGLKLPGVIQQ